MSIARLLGREDHGHEFPFELRISLDFRHVGGLLGDPIYDLTSKLGVGDLPAAEHERHLHLVSFLQDLSRVASLGHEVMLLDAGRYFTSLRWMTCCFFFAWRAILA